MNEGYYFCFSTKLEKFIICWYDGMGIFTTTGSAHEMSEKDFDIVCADPIPYPGVTSYPGVIELGNVMHHREAAEKNVARMKRVNFFRDHPELVFLLMILIFILLIFIFEKLL